VRQGIPFDWRAFAAAVTPCTVDVIASWLTAAPGEVAALRGCLSADECARADRLMSGRIRDRFVVGRGRLRHVLGELCGCPPGGVRFAVGEGGKPGLADPAGRLHFNIAHSNDLMLCAVTLDHEVGIDVEQVRQDFDYRDLARRFLAEDETRALGRLPAAQQREAFFACWTRKEAVIKATGEGVARRLDSFAVTVDPQRAAMVSADPALGRPEEWSLLPVPVPPRYQGTVAVRAPMALRLAWWPDPLPWPGL